MNQISTIIVIVLLAVGGWFLFAGANLQIVSTDMAVKGSFTTEKPLQFTHGAKLIVNGDLTQTKPLSCDGGPLDIEVTGNATFASDISCQRADGSAGVAEGISIVVKGNVTFSKSARVSSNGNVQIVNDAAKLARTPEAVGKLYDFVAQNSGTKPRIGPFVDGSPTQKVIPKKGAFRAPASVVSHVALVSVAHAAEPTDQAGNVVQNVVIGGVWHVGDGGTPPAGLKIPTPPKGVIKIVVNFNFGPGANVNLVDFHLTGPDGQDGDSDVGHSCNAKGGDGANALRFNVHADAIQIDSFTLELGKGGAGGDAETTKDCDPGIATGGKGGEAGNFKMEAESGITINSFDIIPGAGGAGGKATAYGKNAVDGCPGKKGGDATATGGAGGKNKKELSALGNVAGVENVTVAEVVGGFGGQGIATAGNGGNGTGCNCHGGAGGKATATGGKGGDASVKLLDGAGTAIGGNGGDATTAAGNGGTGGMCPLAPSGGNGGKGGDAKSLPGRPGSGTTSDGQPGQVTDEIGGNGGNGGDGCGPGGGGQGGSPNGKPGKPGAKKCPEAPSSQTTPPPETTHTGTTPTNTTGTTGTTGGTQTGTTPPRRMVQAINYQGKYIPVSELMVMTHSGCSNQPHWHSKPEPGGPVQATDGSTVFDPGPECGFGTVEATPVMEVPVQQ